MTSLADHIRENRVFLSLLKMLKRHGCKFLLAEVAGPGGWDEIRKGCVRLPAFGREVWTLDLPSLIRAKRAAGRPKDLLSCRNWRARWTRQPIPGLQGSNAPTSRTVPSAHAVQ